MAPDNKFAPTTREQTLVGASHNALFRIDPRVSGTKMVESQFKQYVSKNRFSGLTTTKDGKLAVASEKGDIRLFDSIGKNAKTALPPLGDPIIGIDCTVDGRYIIAMTKTCLLLVDTLIGEGDDRIFPLQNPFLVGCRQVDTVTTLLRPPTTLHPLLYMPRSSPHRRHTIASRPSPRDKPAFLYLFTECNGAIAKIGRTNNTERRRKEWARKCEPEPQTWVCCWPVPYGAKFEALVHAHYKDAGAWIRPKPCASRRCRVKHREKFRFAACGGLTGVERAVDDCWESWGGINLERAWVGYPTTYADDLTLDDAQHRRITRKSATASTPTNARNTPARTYSVPPTSSRSVRQSSADVVESMVTDIVGPPHCPSTSSIDSLYSTSSQVSSPLLTTTMPTGQPRRSRRIQQRLESKPLQLPPTSVPRSVRRKDAKGYLYFCLIRRGHRLVVKIGCTNNWKRRRLQHYRKCRVQKQNWILVYEVALRYRAEKILHQYFKDVEPSWLGNHKRCAFCTTRHREFFDLERSGGIERIQRVTEGYLLEEDGVVNRVLCRLSLRIGAHIVSHRSWVLTGVTTLPAPDLLPAALLYLPLSPKDRPHSQMLGRKISPASTLLEVVDAGSEETRSLRITTLLCCRSNPSTVEQDNRGLAIRTALDTSRTLPLPLPYCQHDLRVAMYSMSSLSEASSCCELIYYCLPG
ncbi:VID27 cytoplasmic protein-domain-containing protein [Mycena amicta]|nr:VID27 cytoplasmic protein-domain-containing protein [Mycena amicta]